MRGKGKGAGKRVAGKCNIRRLFGGPVRGWGGGGEGGGGGQGEDLCWLAEGTLAT